MRRLLPLACLAFTAAACGPPCDDPGLTCTIAGTGSPGAIEGEANPTKAPLYGPMDVIAWPGRDAFFIGDWNNHKIRLVEDGAMRTIVGTDFLGDGDPDFEERVAPGVLGTEVALNHPTQAEWDPVTETLLVPSWHNHRVRQWDPATGNSLVVCANTAIDDGNGANAGFAGDGGPPEDALFAFPNSIAVHPETGEFWLLDQRNNRIRWVAADRSVIDTVAGNGEATFAGDGGGALDASFNFWDIADLQPEPAGGVEYVDGTLYVADTSNHAVRVIDLEADLVSSIELGQRLTDSACDPDAWCFPSDVELGPDGRLYVADTGNHVIRAVDLDTGAVEVVAGTFEQADGGEGLLATETALDRPHGVDFADDGALLIADTYNHRIRRVAP